MTPPNRATRGSNGKAALWFAAIGLAASACAPAMPRATDAAVPTSATGRPSPSTTLPGLPTTAPQTTTTSTTLVVGESLRIVHAVRDRSSVLPPFDARIEFPIVEGEIADPQAIGAVNSIIEAHVGDVAEPAIELLEAVGQPRGSDPPSAYAFTYEVAYASEQLLSIRFFEESRITGTDLVRRGVSTLLLGLTAGVAFGLDDLVLSGDSKPAVAQLASTLVREKYYATAADQFGPYEDRIAVEGVQHILLVADGLEVWFDELTAGPAELGTPTVTIPYGELDGVLDPESPAGEFLTIPGQ